MGMTKSARATRRELVERLLAERDREGLSLAELARRSGIPQGTLAGWVTRLGRAQLKLAASVPPKPAPFVELLAPASRSEAPSAVRFEVVRRNERRVLVGHSFEDSAFLRLVRVLEAC